MNAPTTQPFDRRWWMSMAALVAVFLVANLALTREEIEANQLQIDSAIESITRIANSTTFQGKKLLSQISPDRSYRKRSNVSDLDIVNSNFVKASSVNPFTLGHHEHPMPYSRLLGLLVFADSYY